MHAERVTMIVEFQMFGPDVQRKNLHINFNYFSIIILNEQFS